MTDAATPEARLFDIEVEQSLLGAMLTNELAIARVSSTIEPDDFYDPLHARLADFIFRAHSDGRAVNAITVGAGMRHDPGLLDVAKHVGAGDDARHYLVLLSLAAPTVTKLEDLARIIAELKSKRDAVDAMTYAQELFAGDASVSDALGPLIHVFDQAQARGQEPESSTSAGDAGHALLKEAGEAARLKQVIAAPSGIASLDAVIGGLYPENLIVVGGRPGMGKSILATTVCRSAAVAGWAPHLFSLEMASREVSARFICDLDYDAAVGRGNRGLAYASLLHHKAMTDAEWERAVLANGRLTELPIEVNVRDKLTIAQIAGLARARAARVHARPLVVIDHLQIVAPSERARHRTRTDEITEITGASKQLAKRLKCPVILLSQLNRDVEKRDDKHPVMSDFRESGSVEQDGDVVIALYRPAYYAAQAIRHAKTSEQKISAENAAEATRNLLELDILKNRNGPTKLVEAWVDVRSSVIRDRDPSAPDDPDLMSLAEQMRG